MASCLADSTWVFINVWNLAMRLHLAWLLTVCAVLPSAILPMLQRCQLGWGSHASQLLPVCQLAWPFCCAAGAQCGARRAT